MNRDIKIISEMLSYRRPAGSGSEAEFVSRFLAPIDVNIDTHKNIYKTIQNADGTEPTVLWSSHTDSVHHSVGRQKVCYSPVTGMIDLPNNSKSSCLGADDAAGVWIMMEMIKAGVPGLYVFHWSEETGCVGSSAIAHVNPGFLANIKAAIAFDRRDTGSVITHMGHRRTCSDAFARSLAAQLPGYHPDDTGIMTDTQMYREIVPECSNLSVGYYNAHQPSEQLDVHHLLALRDTMVKIDQSRFAIERNPEDGKISSSNEFSFGGLGFGKGQPRRRRSALHHLVYHHPGAVTDLLQAMNITAAMLQCLIDRKNAGVPISKTEDLEAFLDKVA